MNAKDLVDAGLNYQTIEIDGIGPVKLRSLTVDEEEKFSKVSGKKEDKFLMFAYLVKLCCPSFKGFWWTPKRIKKKLALQVLLKLADHIMKLSGYGNDAVDESVKS